MTKTIPRLAASVFTALVAVAVLSVSTAQAADTDPISTTCGAGTLEKCGDAPDVKCDWSIEVGGGSGWNITVKISKSNCRIYGYHPIYKNMEQNSSLSGSCNFINPFLGMPAGTGCSDEL